MKSFPTTLSLTLVTAFSGLPSAAPAQTPPPPPAAPAQPTGSLDAYKQYGYAVARSAGIADLNWSEAQYAAFVSGLRAALEEREIPLDEPGRQLLGDMQRRVAEVRAREKAEQDPQLVQFQRLAAAGVGMQQSDSGLLFRVIMPGAGPRPQRGDLVVANFQAKLPDGTTVIPVLSGQSVRFRVGDMPPGVNEGLQMLALGGHAVFVLPPHLSFGGGKWPEGVEPGMPILLQIDLEDILPAGPPAK